MLRKVGPWQTGTDGRLVMDFITNTGQCGLTLPNPLSQKVRE